MGCKPRIRILPEFPLPVVCGGLELQCLKTFSALQRKGGVNVQLLDYYNHDDEFDILHIFGNPAGLYEIIFHAVKAKRVIVSAVCGAQGLPGFRMKIHRMLAKIADIAHQRTDYARLRFMFQAATHVVCNTELEKQFIARTYEIPMSKLTVIPNGVEEGYFSATPDRFVEKYGMTDFVLYTGNIIKRKNPLRLAKVLRKLGLKGVFIGKVFNTELEYAAQFEEIISCSPNLLWIRGLPHDAPLLISAYAAASVFCLPSSGETQTLSALEAMATGTPIILGDFPYAYQPPFENALRCNPDDEGSIENCIKQIFESPDKYRKYLPRTFTWENVAAEILNVYETVMKNTDLP